MAKAIMRTVLGDTPVSIAAAHKISVKELRSFNPSLSSVGDNMAIEIGKEIVVYDNSTGPTQSVARSTGITLQERRIVAQLAAAMDMFLSLPVEFQTDEGDFRRAIHTAQMEVLSRATRREINAQ